MSGNTFTPAVNQFLFVLLCLNNPGYLRPDGFTAEFCLLYSRHEAAAGPRNVIAPSCLNLWQQVAACHRILVCGVTSDNPTISLQPAQYWFTPVLHSMLSGDPSKQCSTYHFSHNIGKLVKLYRPAAVGVELGNNLTNLRLAALQPEKLENVEQLCNNSLFLFLIKRRIVLISTTKRKTFKYIKDNEVDWNFIKTISVD